MQSIRSCSGPAKVLCIHEVLVNQTPPTIRSGACAGVLSNESCRVDSARCLVAHGAILTHSRWMATLGILLTPVALQALVAFVVAPRIDRHRQAVVAVTTYAAGLLLVGNLWIIKAYLRQESPTWQLVLCLVLLIAVGGLFNHLERRRVTGQSDLET